MRPSKKQWISLTTVGIFLLFSCYGCGKTATDESSDTSESSKQQTTDASSAELTAAAAQQLIPEAASMSRTDLEKMADGSLELHQFEGQSLSWVLWRLHPRIESSDNPAVLEDFNYLPGAGEPFPNPAMIYEEIMRTKWKGYGTFLHPASITHCTCNTEGETASGFVMFNAPDLYSGKVRFVARRNEGSWQIEEFHLPNYGITTVLKTDGKWHASNIFETKETDAPSTRLEALTNPLARQLICKAASMSNANFKKFAGPQSNLQADQFENKSLTLILMTLNPQKAGAENAEVLTDFQYLGGFDLQKFTAAINQSKSQGYASIIQPALITHSACNAKEETATGFVTFHAKDLYSGRVYFLARPHDGSWRIEEFHLPNYDITLVLGKDGNWQHAIAEATEEEASKPAKEATP